ncbi:hypothetical protein CPB86DRAFT_821496 [Serendipita vermifera]|nr:hypothetical protein CPB86DRAFT_821496 [Serendipita vermifera]
MADFPLPMSEAFLGTLDNPALSQTYRKAVIKPAPSSFTIQIHTPRKQGANYHYGMRVIPLDAPSSPVESSARSTRTTKSVKGKEYDIFRRWEDCLEFQRTLEVEYDIIAHRRRKGQPAFNHHTKRALYSHQRAASFDSLPLGPDPSSIGSDVHEYIPKLSKKNNLFGRVNQALINQRGEEFKRMIEALICDPDAHSTIQELRTVPLVRDFFALWRRDKEAERRGSKTASTAFPLPPSLPSSTAVDETSNNVIGTINEDSVLTPGGGDSVATGLPVPVVPKLAGGANVPPPKSPGGLNPYLMDFVKPHSYTPSSAKKKPSRHSLAPATRSNQTTSGGSVGSGESDGPRRPNTGTRERPHTSGGSGGEERSAVGKLAPLSPNPFKQSIQYHLQASAAAPADPSARRGRTAYPPPPYQQPTGPIPSRPVRSNTLPLDSASSDYHDGPGNAPYSSQHPHHLQSSGSREALVLRSVNNGLGNQELPIPRAGSMPPERQRRKAPSPISTPRIADTNGNQPLPVFMLPQQHQQPQQHPYPAQPYPYPHAAQGVQGQSQVPSGYLRNGQPGWGRRATLRDAEGEESDGVATPASAPLLTSFPFGEPDSPATPGLAGRGRPSVPNLADPSKPLGRRAERNLGSLAVLDPEMFRAHQANISREALSDRPATSSGELSSQPIPRARKTPPIYDNANRSARFFVNDAQNGMVDVANGPPPVSPGGYRGGHDYSEPEVQKRGVIGRRPYEPQMVARPESNILDADMDQLRPGSSGAGLTREGSGNSIQLANQYQHPNMAMKLSQPPPGKPMTSRPRPTIDPNSYGAPHLDTSRALGSGHNPTLSVISGVSAVPSLTSQNATLSWSSQASPSSPTAANGIPQPRYRSRVSMNSIEARRLSLDSLMTMSEYELPYLSSANPNNAVPRNLVGNPHRFSKQNKSVDALYAAANGKGRSSYSSQETDSTGTGGLPDDGSGGSSANRVYPTKSPLIAAKSTPPPPRPPRSALRNSSQFSAGVINRLNESLATSSSPNLNPSTEALPEMPSFTNAGGSKHDSHDFIDHYFPSPQLKPQTLDTSSPVLTAKTTAKKPRESNMSTITNIAQYYQNTPEMYARELDSFVPSLPPTPYTTTFDLSATESSKASHRSVVSRNSSTSLPSGMALVKASYVGSETIVVFKVSRADTTLHDLRAKLIRKFKETDGKELQPFSLKYISSNPQSDRSGNSSTKRQRTLSITSAFDSSLVDLNTEEDWQDLLSSSTKIMIKIL